MIYGPLVLYPHLIYTSREHTSAYIVLSPFTRFQASKMHNSRYNPGAAPSTNPEETRQDDFPRTQTQEHKDPNAVQRFLRTNVAMAT